MGISKERILQALKAEEFATIYGSLEGQTPSTEPWVSCLCPFHSDSRNSARFNKLDGVFECFAGCAPDEDHTQYRPIDFFMRLRGLSFREALDQLAEDMDLIEENHGSTLVSSDPAVLTFRSCTRSASIRRRFDRIHLRHRRGESGGRYDPRSRPPKPPNSISSQRHSRRSHIQERYRPSDQTSDRTRRNHRRDRDESKGRTAENHIQRSMSFSAVIQQGSEEKLCISTNIYELQ